ncbi:MAG TPA: LiaF domain-containing protein [Symbiobacteriaceae bacterium]|nr:LiaF domain-containing protein [Symbiobacteriaceae bacterium]
MKRQVWGSVFTILGILALVQALTSYNLGLAFWPVVLLLIGFGILWSSFRRLSWFGLAAGLWLFGIGLFDILNNAGVVTDIDGGYIFRSGWPVVLVAIGISMVFGKRPLRITWDSHSNSRIIGDMRMGQGSWVLDGDLKMDHGIGDVKVDLTTATITDGVHFVRVHGGVGDVVIRVPDNVNVTANGTVGIGDLDVLGEHRSGFGCKAARKIVVPDSPVEIIVECELGIGDVDIVMRPSSTPRVIA